GITLVAGDRITRAIALDAHLVGRQSLADQKVGNQCDAIKAKAALIDCLGPDRRVEVRVTGVQGGSE
ncbi:hypothetical protein CF105_10330, partial [Aeromonas veronii]